MKISVASNAALEPGDHAEPEDGRLHHRLEERGVQLSPRAADQCDPSPVVREAREAQPLRLEAGDEPVEAGPERVLARPDAQVPEEDVAVLDVAQLPLDELVAGEAVGGQLVAAEARRRPARVREAAALRVLDGLRRDAPAGRAPQAVEAAARHGAEGFLGLLQLRAEGDVVEEFALRAAHGGVADLAAPGVAGEVPVPPRVRAEGVAGLHQASSSTAPTTGRARCRRASSSRSRGRTWPSPGACRGSRRSPRRAPCGPCRR